MSLVDMFGNMFAESRNRVPGRHNICLGEMHIQNGTRAPLSVKDVFGKCYLRVGPLPLVAKTHVGQFHYVADLNETKTCGTSVHFLASLHVSAVLQKTTDDVF